jgi:hypothetical protein
MRADSYAKSRNLNLSGLAFVKLIMLNLLNMLM